ncbi:hypothetical protein EDD17DRAFT_1502811 [Pisolithus thermaeus]|nr:hypothetical protein EDD17DRAFT_1502811 [Pisolithus thermaeus]
MLSTLLSLLSPTQHYRKILSFSAAAGSIHALAISIDGAILATGGTHGIRLWNIKTCKETGVTAHLESHGTKQKYYQEICARRLGAGLEVTCFAWDPSSPESSHIAVGTHDHAVQVLSLSSSLQLQSVFAGHLDNIVPKALCFVAHNLYVFGLYDSKVLKESIKDGIHSGSAAVYLKKGIFVIDNATDGFTLYHLNGADPIQTFVTDVGSGSSLLRE